MKATNKILALMLGSLVFVALTNPNSVNSAASLQKPPSLLVSNTEKYLVTEAALLGVSDNISLYFKDMQQPNSPVGIDPTRSWIPASIIKSYVLLEAFRQKKLGLINFDQQVSIKSENVVPTELETDDYPRLREGTTAKISQLIGAMITQSDNTAYNTLLDILDRRNINTSLRNLGITETVVGEKLNLDGEQFQTDLQIPGRQPNTTTVKDLATFFSLLYTHQIPDSEEILSIFKKQKINNMIPARLPEDTVVAHKTGDWEPIYHDGGIVYKPTDPFVFVAFTNSGDPSVVAKLAEVAYFNDPAYVGKNLTYLNTSKRNLAMSNRPVYSMTPSEQVLGEKVDNKFPNITAEDLGITSQDLMPDTRQVEKVNSALIVPGSVFYDLKKFFEEGQLQLSLSNRQKAKTYLGLANTRLSEIKNLLSNGQVGQTDQLLSEAVEDIKNATDLAKNDPQKDLLLIKIKKTNDLYYAVMADKAASLPSNKKAEFVDAVYNFYQKSKAEVSPIINSSVIVSPTQQQPVIGVVEKVSPNQMILRFDDGSTKQVNLSTTTNVRSSDQEKTEDLNALKPGTKVAVLGPSGENNIINAQFVLNNIPKGLTDQHQGTVTEVNPNQGTIKLIDKKGQVNLVKVDDSTTVKSKDTNVSLEGIKAGSQVVVFGVPISISSPTSSASASASITTSTANPTNSTQVSNTETSSSPINSNSVKSSNPARTTSNPIPTNQSTFPAANPPSTEIKATSVTIVGNNSGKEEKKQSAPSTSPSSSNPQSKSSPQQANTPQPASEKNNPPPLAPATSAPKTEDKKDQKK
ncbi:serine hydrolase [Candidatus Daviesbacteria bacterium]|nr:serine hydrolase [Candidatus Daviesbacteria bacterium]